MIQGLGFNVDLNHFDARSLKLLVKKLIRLKAKWIRIEIDRFKYQDNTKLKKLAKFCQECKENNIEVVALLTQFVPLTILNLFVPHFFHKPVTNDIKEYLSFVRKIVPALKSYTNHWEIWNEQNAKRFWINNPNPKEYVEFFHQIKKEIRAVDSKANIIFGGLMCNDIFPKMPNVLFNYHEFLNHCLDLGVSDHVNFIAFHPYTSSCYASLKSKKSVLENIKAKILEIKKHFPKHPLIITEIGVSPTLNFRLKSGDIANIYHDLIKHCSKLKIPICLYILSDPHTKHYSRFNPDRDFGFLDYNLKEKELYSEFLKGY